MKWEKDTEAYKVTKSAPAEDLDEETTKRLSETALAAYQALKLRDYGRIDMRLTEQGRGLRHRGQPQPLAVHAAPSSRWPARKAGRTYTQLIWRDRGPRPGALPAVDRRRALVPFDSERQEAKAVLRNRTPLAAFLGSPK